ncbi:MAG: gamma carbonic anhydrase family protein [Desulfovibrionaceae bacterium]|jgi:carbonic anhydrase/acetyltransferase-like protein (isoleucine patch superfamily)|nr:gamma carbonic anhydrase family protein [Desulfovibrionaceae bacterium]
MLYQFDGKRPRVGKGSYVSDSARVIGDVTIGDGCYVGHGAIVRGDYGRIVIGDETAVEEGVIIHAPPKDVCTIGRRVTMGHGAIVHAKSLGDLSVIGMGAVVSLWAEVGEEAIVAEGAVVRMRQVVPPAVVMVGSPARAARPLADKDREFWAWGKQLYVDLALKYLEGGFIPLD